MHSFLIYTGISHINQLKRLCPEFITRLQTELESIALRFGGRPAGRETFSFPPSPGESARKTAEAAWALHGCLQKHGSRLYGSTVLVTAGTPDASFQQEIPETVLLKVPDEDGFWLTLDLADEFADYFTGEEFNGMFRIRELKETGPRFGERLPALLIRPEHRRMIRKALEHLEVNENDRSILLLRGPAGTGKRATFRDVLSALYPDDGGAPLTIPFDEETEDPMEPFMRALNPALSSAADYLTEDESRWWTEEGLHYLEQIRQGQFWSIQRDQGAVDLIQAFALFIKAHAGRCRRNGRPAYVVVDGFLPDNEAVAWLRTLLNEFSNKELIRLVVIWDSEEYDKTLPISGRGHEIIFNRPDEDECRLAAKQSGADIPGTDGISNLYQLFHKLTVPENDIQDNAGEALVNSLDSETRCLLFLVYASGGLGNRQLLTGWKNQEEQLSEDARYQGLIDFGLIREDPDGRVRLVPDGPEGAFRQTPGLTGAAGQFGQYLCRQYSRGYPVSLFRLFRYLERWGPSDRAIHILDCLLDGLLTNRRLRAAGLLLNGSPMAQSNLNGPAMEALQNVLGAARLRYVLLTGGAAQAQSLVRDGTISLISTRGTYSDRFRLHNARFCYASMHWDDALKSSREALFSFQKTGNHEGETYSHLELGLALLATGRIRDAQEHFGIARRIGTQISTSWGVLRAAAMETVTSFIAGNLSAAMRESQQICRTAHRSGRRDLWLLMTLVSVRTAWELGHFEKAAELAAEGQRTAEFYSLTGQAVVMEIWKGRSLLAFGNQQGREILNQHKSSREALIFLSEADFFAGNNKSARQLAQDACRIQRSSRSQQGETDDWSDGFFPLEGRLADLQGPMDVLGDWCEGFDAFLTGEREPEKSMNRLRVLMEDSVYRMSRPFSYHYAFWASLVCPVSDQEEQTRLVSRAFGDLQTRAARFDDNQTKRSWLTDNEWNKMLMNKAQLHKFL